jgi:hypothetical protein
MKLPQCSIPHYYRKFWRNRCPHFIFVPESRHIGASRPPVGSRFKPFYSSLLSHHLSLSSQLKTTQHALNQHIEVPLQEYKDLRFAVSVHQQPAVGVSCSFSSASLQTETHDVQKRSLHLQAGFLGCLLRGQNVAPIGMAAPDPFSNSSAWIMGAQFEANFSSATPLGSDPIILVLARSI